MHPTTHAYPSDLAAFVAQRWDALLTAGGGGGVPIAPLPPLPVLEQLLSVCYQASLLRDEERPVTFRLVLAAPSEFPAERGPPSGLHRMLFSDGRPLDEHELRRLSQVARFARSLIGVHRDPAADDALRIWGVVHSGPRWLQSLLGSRGDRPPVPPVPLVGVSGPGRLAVNCGATALAVLSGGRIAAPGTDVFGSRWLPAAFAPERGELLALHEDARAHATVPWAGVDIEIVRLIGAQLLRRVIATIRNAHHGGTVLIVPSACADALLTSDRYVRLKYKFADEEPRRRYRSIVLKVLRRLAIAHGQDRPAGAPLVGWSEYAASHDEIIAAMDEAMFELAHLIASLADTDGAVVLTKRLELLGFGGVVSGDIPDVAEVLRAQDLEGEHCMAERADGMGTRHRAVYRLCSVFPDAIGIVVSQDGDVRFVCCKDGAVTYWDQVGAAAVLG